MRLLFILPSTELGGAEMQAIILAEEILKKPGFEVFFILFGKEKGKACDYLDTLKIRYSIIKTPPSRLMPLTLLRIIRLTLKIKKYHPDVLLPYCWYPNYYTTIVWQFFHYGIIIWNQRDGGLEHVPDKLIRRIVKKNSGFIANSTSGMNFLKHSLNIDPSEIRLIHNGVQAILIVKDKDQWRKENNFHPDSFLITMTGNLHYNKDHETLFRAFKYAMEKIHGDVNLHLLLAGRKDVNFESLVRLSELLNITTRVHFLGVITDIGSLLNASDLFVLSSRSEGLPNVVLEAMSIGIPITGTKNSGMLDALGKSCEKYLAEPGDYMALGKKILDQINHSGMQSDIVKLNKDRVNEIFTKCQLVSRTCNYIYDLLGKS
jgi:glycosyltransferase involved in cell wall biosynthesis